MSGTVGKMTYEACNSCTHHSDIGGCDVPTSIETIRRVDYDVECYDYVEIKEVQA